MPQRDVLYEAVQEALAEAGLSRGDIDTALTISSDLGEGRGLSQQGVLDSIGGVMRPFDLRVANESLVGLAAAGFQLQAGSARSALVAGVWRASDLAEGETSLATLLVSRLNPFYERPVLGALGTSTRFALCELLDRGAGLESQPPPPLQDLAVAVILHREASQARPVLRSVGWHAHPSWSLGAYEASVRAAATQAFRQMDTIPKFSWIDVPSHPPSISQASLRGLDMIDGTAVNPRAEHESNSWNTMMQGLYQFAQSVRTLRNAPAGTAAVVQSWQGFGSSGAAVAVLETR